jgi:hypothetical protein
MASGVLMARPISNAALLGRFRLLNTVPMALTPALSQPKATAYWWDRPAAAVAMAAGVMVTVAVLDKE